MPEYIEGDDYVEGDEYVTGEDDDANDVLGAVARQLVKRSPGMRRVRSRSRQTIYRRPPLPAQPAQPTEAELRSFMGFGSVTWAVADAANKVSIVEPQESFRGERLILDISIPATITNAPLVTLVRIDVGTLPQAPSVEFAAPAAMFRPDATNANLDLQVAYRGTKIQVTLGITAAPAGAGVVTAVIGMFGQWIR